MLARVAASHLEQLDGKEVNGELSGEDHDKDEDADGGKAVHVFPVDRLHSFNQVRSWLLVLDLFKEQFCEINQDNLPDLGTKTNSVGGREKGKHK